MATVQALPLSRDPSKSFSSLYPSASSLASTNCIMGSVGSLIEKPDVSPSKSGNGAVVQGNGPLRKAFNQRELLNYLNITKKEHKAGKHMAGSSGNCAGKRERSRQEENVYAKIYHKDGKEVDVGKNSLPIGGKFDKPRFRPSAFKPVTPKTFSSVQNLYPSAASDEPTPGMRRAKTSKSLSAASSSSSLSPPSRTAAAGTGTDKGVLAAPRCPGKGKEEEEDEEETASDSGHNSMSSLPPYRPPLRPHLAHISASMGHIELLGSLDRSSLASKKSRVSSASGAAAGGEGGLGRFRRYAGEEEPPPPYEVSSRSLEEVVRELEERLQEKEHEVRQMRRNLDESEDAIAQVFEGKQRLWEKEVAELKQLYATKLRQVSQQSQRSERAMQLQLYKTQQERSRLQEELHAARLECQSLQKRADATRGEELQPQLEETQWELCQKAGEISLLKQQLKDSQAEVTQKLGEIFQLKTQLREVRAEMRAKDGHVEALQLALEAARRTHPNPSREDEGQEDGAAVPTATEERLRAELLLERRQSEAQVQAFEAERRTWQLEKDKVIRYQKELQASYLDMHRKNESLEREVRKLRAGGGGSRSGAKNGGGILEEEEAEEERSMSGLPWIERIESSEI